MYWLIEERTGEELRGAYQAALTAGSLKDLVELVRAESEDVEAAGDRLTSTADGVSEIRISGVLLPGASLFSYLYGGGSTRYGDIRDALAKADQDPAIKRVVLNIDSPGGSVNGLFETLDVLRSMRKPVSVRASAAESAAYAIAAAAGGSIEATSEAARFGSIGVATGTYYFMQGEEVITITSTEAPDKRPDVRTEEGRAVVRKHLDAVHELFVGAIAEGRRTKVKDVNANYGRGATLLAREAKAAGMIDKVPAKVRRSTGTRLQASAINEIQLEATASTSTEIEDEPAALAEPQAEAARGDEKPQPTRAAGNDTRELPMNEDELKAQHPTLYTAVFEAGKKAGHEAGVAEERDRCEAHLILGEASGDMQTATDAIKSGEGMTAKVQAKYQAAGMNRADQTARETETTAAAETVEGAETPSGGAAPTAGGTETASAEEGDLQDGIVAILEQRRGKKRAS